MQKQYGDFVKGKKEFRITERDIPRNWYNYLWNDNYITFVSQVGIGESFAQDDLGNRIFLVAERGLYLLEDEKHWGILGQPVEEGLEDYFCTHGHGYTKVVTKKHGISSEVSFFVPESELCEIWKIQLENTHGEERKLRLLSYADHKLDGVYALQGYNTGHAWYEEQLNGVVYKGHKTFRGVVNREYYGFMAMSAKVDGYDATRNAFIGTYGSVVAPKAVKRGGCTNTDGLGEKLAFALQKDIVLQPGERKTLIVVCGLAFSMADAVYLKERYSNVDETARQMEHVVKKFSATVTGVEIETEDEKLNEMFYWLVHQSNMGSRWARVRSNGYRDICSDTDCLATVNPKLALERFERILSYQYSNGYAPRNILNGKINDNNFSDNTVWLTMTAYSILKELGDLTILDRKVKFNDGTEATIYEHLKRSVNFLYEFRGLHNLIRIWGGDWNDCMNTAGLEGKGVSVWLSIAWYRANKMFGEIAELYGKTLDADIARKRGQEMQQLIEEHGWDGEYYLDAYNDWDEKIGSKACEEGKIFLIPQLWAVMSGVSTQGREVLAMEAVEKYLSSPLGTKISTPAYTKYNPRIGIVTLKSPGIHENGGVYLHTIAWKIAVDAMLKRPDKVEQDIETILPFRNKVVDGRAEPYIMCNSYFGEETGYRYGTPGQSWRTAAGQWFLKALINYVYGLMPEMEGLKVEPCLPVSWKKAAITKTFRDTVYHIRYHNNGVHLKCILVDGKEIQGNILPQKPGERVEVLVITE